MGGQKDWGGKIPDDIQNQNVQMIFSTNSAFVALLENGSAFGWGNKLYGGNIPHHIQIQLHQNVQMIFSNDFVFLAKLNNGHFVGWGFESRGFPYQDYGGKITNEIQNKLENVKAIFSSSTAFAALTNDESVFTWGLPDGGGKIPNEFQFKLIKNVKMIFPLENGFIALCNNGEMIRWDQTYFINKKQIEKNYKSILKKTKKK